MIILAVLYILAGTLSDLYLTRFLEIRRNWEYLY